MKKIFTLFLCSGHFITTHCQTVSWGINMGGTISDAGVASAVDDSGNVYVTGKFSGTADFDPSSASANLISNGSSDIFIAKYTNTGQYKWAFNVGNILADEGLGIAMDSKQNIIVTGDFQGPADFDPSPNTATLTPAAYNDIFIAKYTRNGKYIWAKDIYGAGYDYGYCVVIGNNDKIFLGGRFSSTADFDPSANTANLSSSKNSTDIFLACYDSTGSYLWANPIGGKSSDISTSFTIDTDNNIYLTGYFMDTANFNPAATYTLATAGNEDLFTAKYDSLGNFGWAKRIGGKGADIASSISTDGKNIYIAGRFSDTVDFDPGIAVQNIKPDGTDGFIAAYNCSSGNYKWVHAIGNSNFDNVAAIKANTYGNVYFTGAFLGTIDVDPSLNVTNLSSMGSDDGYTIKYDTLGNFISATRLGNNGTETPTALTIDKQNNIYITGNFYTSINFTGIDINSAGQNDIFVAKYSDLITHTNTTTYSTNLNILYPNPCTNTLIIHIQNPNEQILFNIYSIYGELTTSSMSTGKQNSIDTSFLKSGIYILETSSKTQTMRAFFIKE